MKKLKKISYLHYIAVLITLGFIACGIIFPNALSRLIESVRDFGLSCGYYFCELFGINHNITPTVNNLPNIVAPSAPLPDDYEGFKSKWSIYWQLFASKENLTFYFYVLGQLLYRVARLLLIIIPFFLILNVVIKRFLATENNDYNKDSKPLFVFKAITRFTYIPIKKWIIGFVSFVRVNRAYWIIWLCLWLFYFNIFTIIIEFFAFYFYFVVSFDVVNIYTQIYKLFMDLSVVFSFIPLWAWVIIGFILFDKFRKKIAYMRLNHFERRNRGFINARPIVTMVCGTMGKKKTTAITDMALSQEVMFRDKAFEKILENDLKFPFFPWINLENIVKYAMSNHIVYNLATCRQFINHFRVCFDVSFKDKATFKSCRRHLKKQFGYKHNNLIFDYDFGRYGFTYNDNLKVVDVWETLEIYTQLYFIYIMQSSLLISNYSVRTDSLLSDLGNFPMWNSDFFKRDSRLIDSFSRHAHILDFDSLRLGRKVIENNINADSFDFGVVIITEVGKERGNNLELSEKKKKDENANQKNDLFNSWLKMVRHSATVDNYPFVRVITDEQRPESWGADARDLCEIVHIRDSGETRLAMPFFSLSELLYSWLFGKFANMYYNYRFVRSDNTLLMHLLKTVTAKIHHYYTGTYNKFGFCILGIQVESGTQDGQLDSNKYCLMSKKIYSKRFSTDCFSDFFAAKALRSPVGIDDLREYQTEKATFEELQSQNSYFVDDLLSGLKDNP